ncbi:MAG: Biofilm operon icaADBC HTH-type negative transcriptional regulator IcaR [candidate division WS2 bacterium]|nr:Biofilm operon icaADBC HTH-type negative transcriptional regulator IcaR [Candidatus Psychracetigena formicireducens]
MRQDTKKYIISTAGKLFSEHSYLGVTMSDIAGKLNITKAALYYHFTSKAKIYKKVLEEVFGNLTVKIKGSFNEETPDKKLRKLIQNYLDFGNKERNLTKMLTVKLSAVDPGIRQHTIKLRKRISNLIEIAVREAVKDRKLVRESDSRYLTSLLTNTMDGILLEYSFLNRKLNSKKMSSKIFGTLFPKVEA